MGLGGTLIFLTFFVYLYKTSGKFRKSIVTAFTAATFGLSGLLGQAANASSEADAFTHQQLNRPTISRPLNNGLFSGKSNNANPGAGAGKPNNDGGSVGNGISSFPKMESIQETEKHVANMKKHLQELEEDSDTEDEKDQSCIDKQISTDVIPTKPQVSGFLKKNGKVDWNKALNEVKRRASVLGCKDFDCSLDRFKALATECGETKSFNVREAITVLQGEMLGFYKNPQRINYGPGVKGIDYVVEGIGIFKDITHVELKNSVGSAIKIANGQSPSIAKQGKKIGAKIIYQQNFWSTPSERNTIENLDPTAFFPASPKNVLGIVDNFDVPSFEKAAMKASVLKGAKNNPNIIFIN